MSPLDLPTSTIIQDLIERGYSVQRGFFPRTWWEAARLEILEKSDSFHRAGIGKDSKHLVSDEIRKDSTLWWEMAAPTSAQKPFVDFFELLKTELNRELFLGLWDFEGHYAIYEKGAFYKTHLDRFQNDSKRTVSTVTFFNDSWKPEDGGQLVIEKNREKIEVSPEAGTFVVFLSDSIPHEVKETLKQRLSFAGWFRTRT